MTSQWRFLLALPTLLSGSLALALDRDGFQDTFDVRVADLTTTGRNDYLILEPGEQSILESADKLKPARLTISVTTETKKIDNVETRIVEKRESLAGKITRITRLYLAIDKTKGDVYCFGKDVDQITGGKVTSHVGAWLTGKDGAHFGLLMPPKPQPGQKIYQELAPNVSMHRVETISTAEEVTVPAGRFQKCLRTKETTPLTSDVRFKIYAPNIGLIADGQLKLLKHGKNILPPPKNQPKNPKLDQGNGQTPIVPHDLARDALNSVGADPYAESLWVEAINDPALSPHQRSDLIEDLNETGFADPKNVTPEELPIVLNRLELIEQLQPNAIDDTNAAAFEEAHKDLTRIAERLHQ